jgi:DNA-binding winged helix-turn-helix (wHTH) protein/tetratricopeptide (TPR) repeat protein
MFLKTFMAPEINNLYRFDEFELHPGRRTLTRLGEKIPLAPKTFDVLLYLVANAGRVVLKQDLIAAVWPGAFVEESNLTQHIFGLRKALADRSSCIVTIPGRGYQFTADVQNIPSSPPVIAPIEATTPASAYVPLLRRPAYYVYATVVVVLCGFLGWATRQRISGAIPGDHHEVVLADFENSTGDPDLDHSLKTLLAIDLTQSPTLVVASDSDTRKVLKLMSLPSDSDLTPAVAREVCERLNDQVVLSGLIARFGQKYLITLIAADCSTGKDLVHTKAVASNRDTVIAAVDSASADMRARLGEPLTNLHRGQPLLLAHTFSLEALKAYSQARALHVKLKYADAVPSYKRAIELDPNFADAWAQLANCYNNLHEAQLGKDAMARAYELRDQAEEPERLRITSMYEYWKTGDRHAAIRTYQAWANLYPRQSNPWVLLGQFQGSVGRPDLAVEALQHAVSLNPGSTSATTSLAEFQRYDGRLDDAKATCRRALARGLDSPDYHRTLLDIAFLQHDDPAFNEQLAWFRANSSEEDLASVQADIDAAQGKMHSAVTHWLHIFDLQQKAGLNEAALEGFSSVPDAEADAGLLTDVRAHLKRYDPLVHLTGPSLTFVIFGAAEGGNLPLAHTYLKYMQDNGKQDSDVNELFGPEGQAAIAIAENRPAQAIAALQPTAPFELADPTVPTIKATAYLAAHQPEAAAREFRVLIDRPYISGLSSNVALAHLGLARALKQQGNRAAARQEYETFFTLWHDADPTLPILKQAHQEYAHLK